MDNFTHTLIGALVGETVARVAPADDKGLPAQDRRNLLVAVMVIGSNLPDLDFLYSTATGSKLDYLLQHRGHTHTVIGALLSAILLFAACEAWWRWRRLAPARADRLQVLAVALLAPLLHIAMDLANNYGVHPFWPLYNGWLYGDSIFIAEPLLWAACAPLAFLFRTRAARVLVALLLAAGIGLSFFIGLVPLPLASAFTLLTAAMLWVGYRAAPRTALFAGIGLWIAVTAMFVGVSDLAGRRIDELAARDFAQARMLDRVLTPMPANPVCWEVMLLQSEGNGFAIRRGMLALAPSWIPAQACPGRGLDMQITAPLEPVDAADDPTMQWHGQIVTPKDRIAELAATNCAAAAFMRFARAPWVAVWQERLVIGDLRYDREPLPGFAEIELENDAACPSSVPPWTPPRVDLLR